jgi:FG-GAP-like repeat
MIPEFNKASRRSSFDRRRLSWGLLVLLALLLLPSCGGGGSGSGGGGAGGGGGGGGGGGNVVQIQHVEPSRVMVGVPQGGVTLAGTNFTANSSVFFDGVAVATSYQSASVLDFQLPGTASLVAQHTVQVSDPANGKSNVATYEVYAPQAGPRPFAGQITQYMSESLITNSLVPDLNGDGRADLVVTIPGPSSSEFVPVVRYGQQDGTFLGAASLGSFTPLFSTGGVLAGDFNGDGHTDLILIGSNSSSQPAYQVLLNDGTGHFSSASTGVIPPSTGPYVAGDFNHDGRLDFACSGSTGGQAFSFFFGNGDGTFAGPVGVGATGTQPTLVSAVDLNNDGYTDLVYLNSSAASNQLRVLLSAANGSYTDIQPVGLPNPSRGFVVSDFNNDHIPDIFAVDSNGMGLAYLGAGDGTFKMTGSAVFAFDGYLSPIFVAGDFDSDGNMDFATRATLAGPDEIVFFWGDGKGNFTPQAVASDHSFALQVGDVNGDGIADVFSAADSGFGYPSVVLGRKDRNIPSPQILLPQNNGPLSTGNAFGDGYTDLLVAGGFGLSGYISGTLYHVQTNGTFATEGNPPIYESFLVDLNGDGIADMVGTDGKNVLIWKGDGSGMYQAPINEIPLPNGFSPLYFRDMDGDGLVDIVLPGAILYGKGNFQFDVVSIPFYENFAVGDFDADGIPDIAVGGGIMFGQGNRTFTALTGSSPLPDSAPPFPTQIVADVNGDGKDDLVLGISSVGSVIEIYLGVGRQGLVQDQALMINGYYPTVTSITVRDFNGDNLPDIAVGQLGGNDLVLFTNDGTGKYQITTYAIGVNSVFSVAADLNRDGKPDLAFLNYGYLFKPPTVTVLLHQ